MKLDSNHSGVNGIQSAPVFSQLDTHSQLSPLTDAVTSWLEHTHDPLQPYDVSTDRYSDEWVSKITCCRLALKNTSASSISKITFRVTEPGITKTTMKNKYVRKENDFSSAERHPHTVIGSALDAPKKNLSATHRELHPPQLLLFSRSVASDSL